jgi:hypothetical protein
MEERLYFVTHLRATCGWNRAVQRASQGRRRWRTAYPNLQNECQ